MVARRPESERTRSAARSFGALIIAGIMTNVVMLNLCYDVPVKLHAAELLLVALVLAAPDMGRLANLLGLGRATNAPPARPRAGTSIERLRLGAKVAFIAMTFFAVTRGAFEDWRKGGGAPRPLLSGIYDVESFTRSGAEVLPLLNDLPAERSRWKTVVFNEYPAVTFYGIGGRRRRYRERIDEAASTLSLTNAIAGELTLKYARPDREHLTVEGQMDGEPIFVRLKRRSSDASVGLLNRGFHWVTEYPANW